jgi:hypothetical protein
VLAAAHVRLGALPVPLLPCGGLCSGLCGGLCIAQAGGVVRFSVGVARLAVQP